MSQEYTARWANRRYLGRWVETSDTRSPVMEPATGATLLEVADATPELVRESASQAALAQKAWAATPFEQRAAVLRKFADLLEARADEINYWNIRECGSIGPKAGWELQATCDQARMSAALAHEPNGQIFPSSLPGRRNYWERVPIGVVGVIAPWNFPLLLGLRSVLPALAVGNSVLLKPDPQTPVTGGLIVAELFEEAGLPEGVLHVLTGGAAVGEAVVDAPEVGMVSFTGSTAVGRKIGERCGAQLKRCALELGGNNAMIVLDDAVIDAVGSCAAWGAFLHQGQICMQAGRHLVHRSLADQYAEKLTERAKALVSGDPMTGQVHLGPLINDTQAAKVERIVQESVAQGAIILAGGHREGRYFDATVLGGVTPDMPAFREEIFGPVAPITVFDSDEEAIALVNASDYGLSAAIHSRNTARAVRVADQLRTGMVHVNDQTVNNEFHVPFGGMGASGNGSRFGGPVNLEEFTQARWVSVMEQSIAYPF